MKSSNDNNKINGQYFPFLVLYHTSAIMHMVIAEQENVYGEEVPLTTFFASLRNSRQDECFITSTQTTD